jgi:hypothetical protein
MFPNMHLFLGALLASVVVLCGGFGVFAAFRVNHEPLSRLPADTVALQLVASEAAGPPPAWHAPVKPRFAVRESVSDVQIDGVMTDAPTPLPVSRVTIQPSSLRTVSGAGPEAAIDASPASMRPRHESPLESPPLGLSAAAALSAPTPSTALIANVSQQPAPTAQIVAAAAPTASPAATATAPVQQAPVAETQAAPSIPDAKPVVVDKAGEPATASMPIVAAVEPPSNPASPASQPAVIASTPPQAAVPEPKARPTDNTVRQMLQKKARQALLRRRLAARKRMAASAASNQSGYQNSAFRYPFFQSAPGAFQDQPATNRSAARKNANVADTASNWPTSQ